MQIHVLFCPDSGLMFNNAFDMVDSIDDAQLYSSLENAKEIKKVYGKHINDRIEVASYILTPVKKEKY
jgi:hypothetical protein